MRTRLRSKVTLLFIVCAVLIAVPVAAALAQDTSTPAAPTIQSDKADYAPGELVTLTGSGWQPGESVHINVDDDQTKTWSRNVDVTADGSGNITDSFNLPDWFVATYKVTATGAQSGTVTTSFTDANPNALTVNPTSVTVTQGTAAAYSVTVQMGGNANQCTTTLSASGLPSGATATFSGNPNPRTGNTNYTSTMTVSTTGVSPGSHPFSVNMTRGSNCQGMGNLSQPATLVVNSAVTTTTVSNITATDSTFGGTTDLSAKVSPAGAPGSVEFFVNGSSTPASGTVNYNQSTGVATLSNYSHGLAASNVAYSVKAVFTPTSGSNYSGSNATNTSALTVNKADTTTTVSCGAGPFTYNGAAHTPCSAEVTGPGGLSQSLTVNYTNNTDAGTATASASFAGNGNYNPSSDSKNFTIQKADTTTTVTCEAGPFTYNGSAHTPCSANVSGPGGLNNTLPVDYQDNTNAGTATASASFAGNGNYNPSQDSKNFTIQKASSTTTVTCPASVTYTGSPLTPCSATVTGAGGLNQSLNVTYQDNTNAGTATASASFNGDSNHNGSSDSKNFEIDKASSTTEVTCPASVTYDGSPKEPCSAKVTGAGGLNENLTVHYTNNTNAGTATASASFAGDANHNGSSDSKNFTIQKASQTITFGTLSDKIVGAADFNVSATASSGLPVSFAASPNATCTISGNTVHIAGVGTCTITASQAGNENYLAAPNVSQSFKVTYNFGGFLQPINYTAHQVMDTNVSTFKGGSTVPVKFQLKDATGKVVQAASAQWITPQKGSATSQPVDETVFTDPATSGTMYKWDGTQYHYNWSTKGVAAGFYYKIGVKLDDGQTYYTYISLR